MDRRHTANPYTSVQQDTRSEDPFVAPDPFMAAFQNIVLGNSHRTAQQNALSVNPFIAAQQATVTSNVNPSQSYGYGSLSCYPYVSLYPDQTQIGQNAALLSTSGLPAYPCDVESVFMPPAANQNLDRPSEQSNHQSASYAVRYPWTSRSLHELNQLLQLPTTTNLAATTSGVASPYSSPEKPAGAGPGSSITTSPSNHKKKGGGCSPRKRFKELTPEEQLMWNMRRAKWTLEEIQSALAQRNRHFDIKRISAEIELIKKSQKRLFLNQLRSGEDDWHDGDDLVLLDAIKKVNTSGAKINWINVSQHVKEMKPVTNYSNHACRDRFEALMRGNASMPLELRPNLSEKERAAIARRRAEEATIRRFEAARNKLHTEPLVSPFWDEFFSC